MADVEKSSSAASKRFVANIDIDPTFTPALVGGTVIPTPDQAATLNGDFFFGADIDIAKYFDLSASTGFGVTGNTFRGQGDVFDRDPLMLEWNTLEILFGGTPFVYGKYQNVKFLEPFVGAAHIITYYPNERNGRFSDGGRVDVILGMDWVNNKDAWKIQTRVSTTPFLNYRYPELGTPQWVLQTGVTVFMNNGKKNGPALDNTTPRTEADWVRDMESKIKETKDRWVEENAQERANGTSSSSTYYQEENRSYSGSTSTRSSDNSSNPSTRMSVAPRPQALEDAETEEENDNNTSLRLPDSVPVKEVPIEYDVDEEDDWDIPEEE